MTSSPAFPKRFTFTDMSYSALVTFIVGHDQLECHIHRQALIQRIPAMKDISEDGSDDDGFKVFYCAKKQAFVWKLADPKIFDVFIQYVYTGTYDTPEPTFSTTSTRVALELPHAISSLAECVPNDATSARRIGNRQHCEYLWSIFLLHYSMISANLSAPPHHSRPNTDLSESHETILKHHVLVADFANSYCIRELEQIAQSKLFRTLVDFKLHYQGAADILTTLSYAYEEELGDKCLEIVVHYVACRSDLLGRHPLFWELVDKHKQFASHFIRVLLNHRLGNVDTV